MPRGSRNKLHQDLIDDTPPPTPPREEENINININTYQPLCDANNLEFRPLIFESSGKLHQDLIDDTPPPSRFSCFFQKCIADAFLSKTRAINGNLIRNCRYHEGHLGGYRLPHG